MHVSIAVLCIMGTLRSSAISIESLFNNHYYIIFKYIKILRMINFCHTVFKINRILMNLWKYKGYANSIYHKIQSFRIIIQSFSSTLLLDLLLLRYRLTFVLSSKKFGRLSRWSVLSDWNWPRSFVSKIFFLFSSSTSLCTFGIVTFLYASGELSISLCSYFERCLMCLKIINTEWRWEQYCNNIRLKICFQKW